MSMIYELRQASQSTIDVLHNEPERVPEFLWPEAPIRPPRPGFFARLFGASSRIPSEPAPVAIPTNMDSCCLDKSWHGLHYLLSGSDWQGAPPAGFLLNWGTDIGDVDMGYGPASSFTPDQTKEIASFLSQQDETGLRDRFDPQTMTQLDLYPNCWDRDPDEELSYLLEYYRQLHSFVERTAKQDLGMISVIG